MGTLAFFPWLRIPPGPIAVGQFELIPYNREGYAGPDAAAIDAITAPYRDVIDNPIEEVTLLRFIGADLTSDLDEQQIEAAFTCAEMVALAGFARRRYFVHGKAYSKRDNYRLVIQRFNEPGKGTFQQSPRRDGTRNVYVMASVHREPCPSHIDLERIELDVALLQALAASRTAPNAEEFVESTMTYNLANTESPTTSPHVELVLSSGALQRVLGYQGSKDDELAARFTSALTPRKDVARADCPRLLARSDKFAKSSTVRDAWVRDLYALRGDLAHGKIDPRYPSVWTIREHLLLASHVFPLVMKAQLAKVGVYKITHNDQVAIDAFETLACSADLFQPVDAVRGVWPWNELISQVADDELKARVIARMESEDGAT